MMKIQTIIKHLHLNKESISSRMYRYKNFVSDGIWLLDSRFEQHKTKTMQSDVVTKELDSRFEMIINEAEKVETILPTIVSEKIYIDEGYGFLVELVAPNFRSFVSPDRLAVFSNIPKNCEVFLTGKRKAVQFRTVPHMELVGLLMPVSIYEDIENVGYLQK